MTGFRPFGHGHIIQRIANRTGKSLMMVILFHIKPLHMDRRDRNPSGSVKVKNLGAVLGGRIVLLHPDGS